jgi:hypothetical protein
MKNVTLDDTTILQLDADGTDSTLDAAGDRHVRALRLNVLSRQMDQGQRRPASKSLRAQN